MLHFKSFLGIPVIMSICSPYNALKICAPLKRSDRVKSLKCFYLAIHPTQQYNIVTGGFFISQGTIV
jgi:hypothetical protein